MNKPLDSQDTTLIVPGKNFKNFLKEIWEYRELFWFLAWRNLLVRYKQTVFGIAWAVVPPLFLMGIFTLIFSRIAGLSSFGIPYPLLIFAGFAPWAFFSSMVSECTESLLAESAIISKTYFPRIILPTSRILPGLLDLGIAILVFYILAPFFHYPVLPRILPLAGLTCCLILLTLGVGYFLAALNIRYHDFRYVVGFALQLALYISPIGFSRSVIPATWRPVYDLNPMVGIIEGFRWTLLGDRYPLDVASLFVSGTVSLFLFGLGLHYFRNKERSFTDYI